MDNHRLWSEILALLCILNYSVGQYVIPEVKFEAFAPRGLRVSIPADKGVELFAFHGNQNKEIHQIEPGDFSQDVLKPVNGRFIFVHPTLQLKEGDTISYWVFVQHEQLGFRKDDQKWIVDKLLPQEDLKKLPDQTCLSGLTKAPGITSICVGEPFINEKFLGSSLNQEKWLIHQYIPNDPDWEFVIYKNLPDIVRVHDSVLHIKPQVDVSHVRQSLVIEGCTSNRPRDCQRSFGLLQNPVLSGRIVFKQPFCFGNVTIRAKLPKGDWVFPEIYLQNVNNPSKRITIAYARGNEQLISDQKDIGGKLLFGGPYTSPNKPNQKFWKSYQNPEHIGNDWHTFTVKWTKDQMDLYIDGTHYGLIDGEILRKTGFDREEMVQLVFGVGAGGPFEFPDGSESGSDVKPWRNLDRDSVKTFFAASDKWMKTWNSDTQLQVQSVTVNAV